MKEVLEYIELIPEFKPVIERAFEGIALYKDEWNKVEQFFIDTAVKSKSSIYKGLIAEGIPPEHAVALTINAVQSFSEGIKSYNGKSKKGEVK